MTPRPPLLGPAALTGLLTLALTACGGTTGAAEPGTTGTARPATSARPSPSVTDRRDEFGPEDRSITVTAGDGFSLTVPAQPSLGDDWYLTDPQPAADILKYDGRHSDRRGSDLDGGDDGTQSFDFTALAKGTATVRLLYCPGHTCGGPTDTASPLPTATATPDAEAAYYVFTVTVR